MEGFYAIRLMAFSSPNSGIYDIQIDGNTVLSDVNFQTQDFEEMDLLLGTHHLSKGEHKLIFRGVSSSASSVSLERIRLLKLPPKVNREVKTDNEAHFIRLGIGRAVYAYRLAYGKLPESLDVLVQQGIMPERYLIDENGFSLRSCIEGEYFVVESSAKNGWKHRWLGIDARR